MFGIDLESLAAGSSDCGGGDPHKTDIAGQTSLFWCLARPKIAQVLLDAISTTTRCLHLLVAYRISTGSHEKHSSSWLTEVVRAAQESDEYTWG